MKTRLARFAALWLAVLPFCAISSAVGDELAQNFAGWTPGAASSGEWSVSNGAAVISTAAFTNFTPNSLRFSASSTSNGILRLPLVTNGIGNLQFYARLALASSVTIVFQKFSNSVQWVDVAQVTVTGATYNVFNVTINEYGTNYFRFFLTNYPSQSLYLDDITLKNPPAKVQIDSVSVKTVLGDSNIYINDPVNITATLTQLGIVSNLSLTAYYRVGESGSFLPIPMTNNADKSYTTSNAIPGQGVATVYYYINAVFQGPPPAGESSPTNTPVTSYQVVARPFLADNASISVVTGSVASAMILTKDYFWECFYPYSASSFSLQFQGDSSTWGDSNQTTAITPFTLQADLSSPAIQVNPSTNAGQLVIRYTETNREYTIKQVAVQLFDNWIFPSTGNDTNNDWVLAQGFTANTAGLQFRNRFLVLESNTASWIRSSYLPGGIGEISFWCRNFNTNGTPAPAAYVESSITGGTNDSEWGRLATVTGISYAVYTRFTLMTADRHSFYVRVRNTTNTPNTRLCLDELMVAQPGAGVIFTNVITTPAAPTSSNTVSISATITPAGNASTVSAKVWYRSGSTGVWASLSMTNAGSTFTTSASIPAGMGDKLGGVGTVQYYIESSFQGYESVYSSPLFFPPQGSNASLSYLIQSPWFITTNAATEPAPPLVGVGTKLRVDLIPQLGASTSLVAATAYYRINGSGGYTALPMSPLTGNTFQTTGSVPPQPISGAALDYYFTVSYLGSDTNYPVNATNFVFSTIYRTAAWTSAYSTVSVMTGNVAQAMILAGDNTWRGIMTFTNALNPRFRFTGTGGVSPVWGDNDPSVVRLPVYGTAELSGNDILMTDTVSRTVLFLFNDTNRLYSAQRATAADLYPWQSSNSLGTNIEGWVLNGRAGQTNGAFDRFRVFNGPFMVLDGGISSNYLSSPYMTNGIGEISFFYRNWDTNGNNPIKFAIEASSNATEGSWVNIQSVTNILTQDYQFFFTVLADHRVYRYVRIRNTSTAQTDKLCIDETVVSEAAADVSFSGLTNSPTTPTVLDEVAVSVTLTPLGDATNFTPVLWYQAGSSAGAYYESVAMTNVSGSLYRALVPRGPITSMYYFVQCGYSGFFSQYTSPSYFPYSGAATPASYFNADGGTFEGFESWPRNISATADYATNGWLVYNAACRSDLTWTADPGSPTNAIWLSHGDQGNEYEESQIITPLITNLYGLVYLTFQERNSSVTPNCMLAIYTTTNTSPSTNFADSVMWAYVTNYTVPTTNWTANPVLELTNNLFRLMIRKIPSTGRLGIDRVEIAQRSAMISFSNHIKNPGYPGTNDAVTISCDIDTLRPGMPAFNLQPLLWYKIGEQGALQGPIGMAKTPGSTRFTTTNPIPASVAIWDADIYYYIQCNFDGYAHTPALNKSPMYYPTNNYASAPFTYTPRLKSSDYDKVDLSTNIMATSTYLDLLESYTWQGILRLDAAVNSMTFKFEGHSYFTGFGFSSIITNWGRPDDQWKTNLPLADISVSGRTNPIVAAGPLAKGQYVARLNERTGGFTFLSCAAQYFESWGATPNYCKSGNSESDVFTIDFNDWPIYSERSLYDDFDGSQYWTNNGAAHGISYYTNKWYNGPTGWGIYDALITNGVGMIGPNGLPSYAVLTKPISTKGWLVNGNQGMTPLEGIGSISFSYKAVSTNSAPVSLDVWSTPTNLLYDAGPSAWVFLTNITGIIANSFNTFSLLVNTNAYRGVAIAHNLGETNVIVDNVSFTDFAANYYATNSWKASEIWIQANNGRNGTTGIEFDGRRFVTNTAYLQTPGMTNGIGFFDFYYKSAAANQPVSFTVYLEKVATGGIIDEEPVGGYTNNNTSFVQYSLPLMRVLGGYTNMFIKLVPTSANRLFIDDVRITGIPPTTSWEANNARIANEDTLRFRSTAVYLNNGLADINPTLIDKTEWPYIKTPGLSNGVGEVSFWYRNWNTGPNPTPAVIRLQKSVNGLNGNTNWSDFAVISNIVNTGYLYYRTNLYDNESRFVRIINNTNQLTARVILDEILVASPMAADITLSNLRISPEAPVTTNTVHVYVDMRDPFLNPTAITLKTEYSVATNYGGWGAPTPLDMDVVSSNVAARTWTYRTINPIPIQYVDQYVMYQIRATFDGYNAQGHTSPKLNRDYRTPSFYYPINNGTNMPYYIVLSVATNAVWINEIDPGHVVNWADVGPNYYDFVEIAGKQSVNLGGWKIVFLSNTSTQVLYSYSIAANTLLPNTTNGIGFYLLGKSTLPVTPSQILTNDIFYPGGVALQRPSGMYSSPICFGDPEDDVSALTQVGFAYIGRDHENYFASMGPNSIMVVGTGSVSSAFTWRESYTTYDPNRLPATPFTQNSDQTFTGSGSTQNLPPSEVHIVKFWLANSNVWLTVTGTNGWLPSPWFTTNLMVPMSSWTNVVSYTNYPLDTTNWTYTMQFPIPTSSPAYFYEVRTTNASP